MNLMSQKSNDTLIFIEDKKHKVIKQVLPQKLWKTMDSIYFSNPIKYDSLFVRLKFPTGKNVEKMFVRKKKIKNIYETTRI